MISISNDSVFQTQQSILIDFCIFTIYSVICIVLFVIWCRTIFFSGNTLSSSSAALHPVHKSMANRRRKSKSKSKVNKSCTNTSALPHIDTLQVYNVTPQQTCTPPPSQPSPTDLAPIRLHQYAQRRATKHCVVSRSPTKLPLSPPMIKTCMSPNDALQDTKRTVLSTITPSTNHHDLPDAFVTSLNHFDSLSTRDKLPKLPTFTTMQMSNTMSFTNHNIPVFRKASDDEGDDEDMDGVSVSMACIHPLHRMQMQRQQSTDTVMTNMSMKSMKSVNHSTTTKAVAMEVDLDHIKKEIKLEPVLKIFATAAIFFAMLYNIMNAIEYFLLFYNNEYFSLHNKLQLNICYGWSVLLTPMFFNRLCIYLYLIFRIHFAFNSSIYAISAVFICGITSAVIAVFIVCYAFFNIYITLIASKCSIASINIALMPARFFDFAIAISLTLIFVWKLQKLVTRCNGNSAANTNMFIEKVKFLINKLLLLLTVSVCGSAGSYALFVVNTYHEQLAYSNEYFTLQSILRFDIVLNTICLMFSLSAFQVLYEYFCCPFRLLCAAKRYAKCC